MRPDHRTTAGHERVVRERHGSDLPTLLLAALAAILASVAAIWVVASTSAAWAIAAALVVAFGGLAGIMAVVDRQLSDSDGSGTDEP